MNEKEKKEEKKDISADVLEVIEQSKVLLEEQKAEIERQREEIEKLKQKKDAKKEKEEKQEVTDILKDFKKDITEMLQGYNRNNPGEDGDNESFEKLQMDMLKRRF